jgi:hypothetical protein
MRPIPSPPPIHLPTIYQMTLKELAARIRWHESLAEMYRANGVLSAAREFMALAAEYRAEMERRPDTAE